MEHVDCGCHRFIQTDRGQGGHTSAFQLIYLMLGMYLDLELSLLYGGFDRMQNTARDLALYGGPAGSLVQLARRVIVFSVTSVVYSDRDS